MTCELVDASTKSAMPSKDNFIEAPLLSPSRGAYRIPMMQTFETELRGVLKRYNSDDITGIILHGTPMERRICVDLFPEHLDRLARDTDWAVRYAVACSPFTSPDTRLMLARDEIREVRIGCCEWAGGTPAADILANDKLWLVRREMAKHASGELLETLARDDSPFVRAGAAVNAALDFETLAALCADDDATVSRWARAVAEARLEHRRDQEGEDDSSTPEKTPQTGAQRRTAASGKGKVTRARNTNACSPKTPEGNGKRRPPQGEAQATD